MAIENVEFRNFLLTQPRLMFVGLGNITKKYENTRHNVGFDFIDKFIYRNNLPELRSESKLESYINRYKVNEYDFLLIKPTTFMNNSGVAVQNASNYLNYGKESLILIHDDLDIPLGEFKINFAKGPREHNGVNSVERAMQTKDFWRIRIGVETRDERQRAQIPGEKYVIMQMNSDDKALLLKNVSELVENISDLIF